MLPLIIVAVVFFWLISNVKFYRKAECYREDVELYLRAGEFSQIRRLTLFVWYLPCLLYDKITRKI